MGPEKIGTPDKELTAEKSTENVNDKVAESGDGEAETENREKDNMEVDRKRRKVDEEDSSNGKGKSNQKRRLKLSDQATIAQRSRIEYLANLDVYRSSHFLRRTGIVCTIGHQTSSVEMLVELRKAGVNLMRINLSTADREFHQIVLDNIRQSYNVFPGPQVAIALDVRGNLIHLGKLEENEIFIPDGHKMKFCIDEKYKEIGNKEVVYIDYPQILKITSKGDAIYTGFGGLKLIVTEIESDHIVVECEESGTLASYLEVLVPGVHADMEPLREEDYDDINWGVAQGVDILLATIRKPMDVSAVREAVGSENKFIKVVSKITSDECLQQFNEILEISDGIMIARGDIGIEILPEKVFLAQKMMIAKCNLAGKSVICSTQMLESMTTNRHPTRAEVSDVANAVLDGADCVMLSSETEKGKYPIESVKIMHRICAEAESIMFHRQTFQELNDYHDKREFSANDTEETVAIAAVYAAYAQKASAIVCLTTSGRSAALVSKYRPVCPILAVTQSDRVTRNLHMYRGIFSMSYPHSLGGSFQDDIDSRIGWGIAVAKHAGYISTGDTIIAIQGWRSGIGHTNTIRVLVVD